MKIHTSKSYKKQMCGKVLLKLQYVNNLLSIEQCFDHFNQVFDIL